MRWLITLATLPSYNETILQLWCTSIGRIVNCARKAVDDGAINIFDQTLINSFDEYPKGKTGRPLHLDLRKHTYQNYINIYCRLLCFIYRYQAQAALDPIKGPPLLYRLTELQRRSWGFCLETAAEIHEALSGKDRGRRCITILEEQLDLAICRLIYTLLDDHLKGDIYESYIVGFIAVCGINPDGVCIRPRSLQAVD